MKKWNYLRKTLPLPKYYWLKYVYMHKSSGTNRINSGNKYL